MATESRTTHETEGQELYFYALLAFAIVLLAFAAWVATKAGLAWSATSSSPAVRATSSGRDSVPADADALDSGLGVQSIAIHSTQGRFAPDRISVTAGHSVEILVECDGRPVGSLRFDGSGVAVKSEGAGRFTVAPLEPGVYPFSDSLTGARGRLIVR